MQAHHHSHEAVWMFRDATLTIITFVLGERWVFVYISIYTYFVYVHHWGQVLPVGWVDSSVCSYCVSMWRVRVKLSVFLHFLVAKSQIALKARAIKIAHSYNSIHFLYRLSLIFRLLDRRRHCGSFQHVEMFLWRRILQQFYSTQGICGCIYSIRWNNISHRTFHIAFTRIRSE